MIEIKSKEQLVKLIALVEAGERPVAIMNELVRERSAIKPGMKVIVAAIEKKELVNFDDQIIDNWCFWLDVDTHLEHNASISPAFSEIGSENTCLVPYIDSLNDGKLAFDFEDNPLLMMDTKKQGY